MNVLLQILDLFIVFLFFYLIILLFKRTGSYFMLNGLIILLGIYLLAVKLNLYLTHLLFGYFFAFFFLVFVIIFQKELRTFLEWIFSLGSFAMHKQKFINTSSFVDVIVESVAYLLNKKIGALIVITGVQPLDRLLEGGFELNGKISVPLLLSIFDPSSPGHDGAVIIGNNLDVVRFGVHLPLSEKNNEFLKKHGTRHRAALGLSERSDAFIIVVSEEMAIISVAKNGEIKQKTLDELRQELIQFLKIFEASPKQMFLLEFVKHKNKEKLLALFITLILWFILVVK
ncbi:MAG: diadenylate cyclase [Minisyncoccia bacterium]